MRVHVFSIARRPPAWAEAACEDYRKRFGPGLELRLREFAPKAAATVAQQREREAEMLLRAMPAAAHIVALDERGEAWSTAELTGRLQRWREEAQEVVFAIGGAEGHGAALRAAAHMSWSLSRLTLPHALARVLVVEQLYRAWSLLHNHPYHRA
ncbi:MAG TPA: 23S rRNA (pseudouridine(1915)-N(3))-methyltransferase RlmH [Gammaproteobacteria bacterium]|nr:23S rRNA (pseudouridine(1915)-N(3))-methyltransferase RlmH [Gammaproteobacteria bacterium]